MFVEDNAELLSYLVENTKALFNVYHANNGLDALEKLETIPKPNIIISDVLMDKMDGFQLFDELMKHEDYRDIPFLFLTGVNTQDGPAQGIESRSRRLHYETVSH